MSPKKQIAIFKKISFEFGTRFSGLGQILAKALLLLSIISTAYFAFKFWHFQTPDFANAFTSSGAVLAACMSALVSFRSISIAEEAQKPYPYPYIDISSRLGLSLLKLKNAGGTAAHQVYLEWEKGAPSLCQRNGQQAETVLFASDADHAISVLMPGDEQATFLGAHHWVFQQLEKLPQELRGNVVFHDVKGNQHKQKFCLDTSFYKWSLSEGTELLKAQYALGKLPDSLNAINKSLEVIGRKITDHS